MAKWQNLIERLKSQSSKKIDFVAGLTDQEVQATEARYGFRFPPDLRDFLQTALPHGDRFPDWRNDDESLLRDWLDLPRRGIVFDVEQGFWLPEWGEQPAEIVEAISHVEKLIAAAPVLVPIFAHRMMPAEPNLAGNPVFSVHQADIIIYGNDLAEYLAAEFLGGGDLSSSTARSIPFWNIDQFQDVRWQKNGHYQYGGFEEDLG